MHNKTTELIENFAKSDVKYVLEHLEQSFLNDTQQNYTIEEIEQFLAAYPTKIELTKKRSNALKDAMMSLSYTSPQYASKIEELHQQKQREPKENIVAEGGVTMFIPIILFILGMLRADSARAAQQREHAVLKDKLDEILKNTNVTPKSEGDGENNNQEE